ncbi:TIGR03619 family F420-dependent LLM class oxidoreductase [Conexibacter sp. CPCC 206217]|uniref:TIGR03619 family F420-dependent LLM class oxidoreductase n=1 Tax=Conexibacter sp. CPCC 206217 TaxID=3064574 RepID=UPI002726414E|nr:TIGR03619 family F420-dependent LLM class oxidoreductase [Conexibacter sp. CPCC 206217]MDO8212662.1 TIGR03619 family F420-dependent LLM class oxidoreductase [Conexibacter sp. CPCC 206217]
MSGPGETSAPGGMRIGAIVPNSGELPGALGIGAMAQAAEAAGADSVWVSDHLLMVDAPTDDYPYSDDGRPTWSAEVDYYEAFACCAYMAAATTSCRIGTAVLVLPQRSVLEVAKTAATIDRLSGGRLELGLGAGWYAAEMEALGYPHRTRGTRFDEMLAVLRDCWSGRPAAFAGSEVTVAPSLVLNPRPLQRPGPPLLVGGMTDPAVRRAARHGDGWLALDYVGKLDPERLAARLELLREQLRDGGGGAARPFTTTLKLHASAEEAGALPAAAAAVERLGFDELIVEPPWGHGLEAVAATLRAVRAALRPSPRGA